MLRESRDQVGPSPLDTLKSDENPNSNLILEESQEEENILTITPHSMKSKAYKKREQQFKDSQRTRNYTRSDLPLSEVFTLPPQQTEFSEVAINALMPSYASSYTNEERVTPLNSFGINTATTNCLGIVERLLTIERDPTNFASSSSGLRTAELYEKFLEEQTRHHQALESLLEIYLHS